ncbi:MAG: c(7)-type cytochrome triheme domain-containing protein [Anaerolineae bacterium]
MDQRSRWVLGFVVGFLALGLALGSAMAQRKPKLPADFAFEQTGESPGKVGFSHKKHFEQKLKCTACHVKVFKMKRGKTKGPLTMARMKKGKLCGACHMDGKKSPQGQPIFSVSDQKTCARCHVKG